MYQSWDVKVNDEENLCKCPSEKVNKTTYTKVFVNKNIQTHFRLTDCPIKLWEIYIFRDFCTSFIQIMGKRNIILARSFYVGHNKCEDKTFPSCPIRSNEK